MSGHSKWATTHRQKSAEDNKRGAIFTKLGRAITIAAKHGANPEANFKLRIAMDQARVANMPKDNIERAIQRAGGAGEGVQLEAISYEGFGPSGVALVVECLSDNRNRTSHEIRHIFEQHGGNIGTPGSVAWQFARNGVITVPSLSPADELALIDLGVTDVQRAEGRVTIICPPNAMEEIRKFCSRGGTLPQAKLALLPKETKSITDPARLAQLQALLAALEAQDDVQEIFHNAALA